MKKYNKWILTLLFSLLIVACVDNPIDKEQYKKEIYLVGGYDRVLPVDVNYSMDESEFFFTVTSSGSKNLDVDVAVSMVVDTELVDTYNQKFLGILNKDRYFKQLDQAKFRIPSLENVVIKHQEEIYARVPVFVDTQTIEPDSAYVIPVRITGVSDYEVNQSGEKMLIELKMKNKYAEAYQLNGTREEGENEVRRIQKVKNLKAVSHNAVRLFYGVENELKENIMDNTLVITLLDDKVGDSETLFKVEVTPWADLALSEGSGTYDSQLKEFKISYKVNEGGTEVTYHETLKRNEDEHQRE